jgi:3-dehydroquinate synthase
MTAAATVADAEKVRVELGDRSYDILIGAGLIASAGAEIARLMPRARTMIVADRNVAAYHLEPLVVSLRSAGVDCTSHVIDAGEASKSFARLEEVVDAILAARLERGDLVIALGGGVVGDLAGFAAGITRRGMNLVQAPTSLLAQVDSSVGGKTGINTPRGKNLVGVFFQPRLVIVDIAALDTLPERHFRAGYAEIAKYGLINDAAFFSWLETNWREVFAGGPARQRAIATSCAAKAAIVAADERESGDRALLNLGHTFGHALEAATGYSDRLIHGEAIAIGMVLAAEYSAHHGLCAADVPARIRAHFGGIGLPTHLADLPGGQPTTGRLMELIGQDKKVARGQFSLILLHDVGEAFVARDIAAADVAAFLDHPAPA